LDDDDDDKETVDADGKRLSKAEIRKKDKDKKDAKDTKDLPEVGRTESVAQKKAEHSKSDKSAAVGTAASAGAGISKASKTKSGKANLKDKVRPKDDDADLEDLVDNALRKGAGAFLKGVVDEDAPNAAQQVLYV